MGELLVISFWGAVLYGLYGVFCAGRRVFLSLTGRGHEVVTARLPRALHIAGRVSVAVIVSVVAFLFWAMASGTFILWG